jgi:uncharacterized protein (DUF58 family)
VEALATQLPPLLVAAERLASIVGLGVHGRRKAGMGETFWQFRRYGHEDATNAIDWRQSAKSQHLFVREREWEAAQAVWLWRDGSAGMDFASGPTVETKRERANLLALAVGTLLMRGGERVGYLGSPPPLGGRVGFSRLAHALLEAAPQNGALPPDAPVMRNSQVVWFGDFLSPLGEIETVIRRLTGAGLGGHLVRIADPAEEEFPYWGRTRFESPSGDDSEILGRAEGVREPYRRRFQAQAQATAALARRFGWSCLSHRTDQRPELALVALYGNLGGHLMRNPRMGGGSR